MPKFMIERNMPGVRSLTAEQYRDASRKSCAVLEGMGPKVQWVQSFATKDKLYCVYIASDEEACREHARRGGFPADRVSRIDRVIDPTTAE